MDGPLSYPLDRRGSCPWLSLLWMRTLLVLDHELGLLPTGLLPGPDNQWPGRCANTPAWPTPRGGADMGDVATGATPPSRTTAAAERPHVDTRTAEPAIGPTSVHAGPSWV